MSQRESRIDHRPRRGALRPGAGLLALGAALAGPASVRAQCVPAWSGLNGGTNWDCNALETFAETPYGPSLFIAGGFTQIAGINAVAIARWDGWRATTVGAPLPFTIENTLVWLYGQPNPSPPRGLYAGGHFSQTGQGPANNLARWWPPDWHDVGGGVWLDNPNLNSAGGVRIAYDEDGPGPGAQALFVGGRFNRAGPPPGVVVQSLARWDGVQWSAVGGGLTPMWGSEHPSASCFAVFDDDGPGPRRPGLYVGGDFSAAGGVPASRIARWDGQAWEPLGQGVSGNPVFSLCVFDRDGPGRLPETLFAGGGFSVIGHPFGGLAQWDGQQWLNVWPVGFPSQLVLSMAVFDDDGPGPRKPALFIGGIISNIPGGGPASNIARWDGTSWDAVGGGVTGFAGGQVEAMKVFDEDGPGLNPGGLYVGGLFYFAGGVQSHHVARWGCPLPPRCDANCNKDFHPVTGQPILTVGDFGCFQTRYVLQDPAADCNEDGQLTVADFGCFQTRFVTGCP